MSVLFFIFAAVAIAVAIMYRAARGHAADVRSVEDLKSAAIPVDLAAFENLISPEDEQFLRERLSRKAFMRVMRKKDVAIIAYLEVFARNAALLLRMAEHSREDGSEGARSAANALANQALNLRISCLYAIWRLRLQLLVPTGFRNVRGMVPAYRNLVSVTASWAGNHEPGSEAFVFQTLQA
jgi:hypothetical protein